MNADSTLGRERTDKVCLFIDNNALSAALGGKKVNFQKLREWLVGHRELSIARVYCGEVSNDERVGFYHYLGAIGLSGCGFKESSKS